MSEDKCSVCGTGLTFVLPADGSARRLVHDDADKTDVCVPPVPVIPAGAESGCLAHREIGCSRCGVIETRHRLGIEAADERGRAPVGVLVTFLVLTVLAVSMACIYGSLRGLGLIP